MMKKKKSKKSALQHDAKLPVVGRAITLRKILKKLEQDFGWSSFYDENGELQLTEAQKDLIIDVAKATEELLSFNQKN
jgi:hypothetical protein